MADVITRFKLETTQYDSKLRDASKSLADLTHHLSMAGKDFERFAKNHVQTAASLGQVASGATNLKDKLKDLVGAYNTAARAYNTLTKDQQSGEFGKAMAASLQKLKQDITQTKNELYNIGEQSKGTGGIMDMLAQKMTVNIDAVRLFGLGLNALSSALGVLKDAFFNNEEQLDEWGRIVESSHSLYNGFLNALNTGDISGYLNNIMNITQAARDAYDALDALGTYNAFNQINVERTRTNMTESIADYRGGSGSKEAVKAAGDAYKKELEDRKRLEKDAYISAVKRMAAERGVSAKDLTDALSGNYGHYQDLKNVRPTGVGQRYVPGLPGMPGSYREYNFAQNDRERLGEALRHLNDTELQSLQALGAQAERTGNEIATVDKQLTRVLNGRQPGSSSGSNVSANVKDTVFPKGSLNDLNQQLKVLREKQNNATTPEAWKEYDAQIKNVTNSIKELKGELPEPGSIADLNNQIKELRDAQSNVTNAAEWQNFQAQIDAVANRIKGLKGQLAAIGAGGLAKAEGANITGSITASVAKSGADFKNKDISQSMNDAIPTMNDMAEKQAAAAKNVADSWRKAGSAVGTFGNILGSLKDPAAQTAAIVAQAIASIALAYADTLAKDKTSKWNIWAFIAASAAAMVSMGTAIANVHSATGYERGGVIPGNAYSGDNQWIRVNAGETVLTRAQTGVLANALQDNSEGLVLESAVRGDDLRLILRRGNLKRGYNAKTLSL